VIFIVVSRCLVDGQLNDVSSLLSSLSLLSSSSGGDGGD